MKLWQVPTRFSNPVACKPIGCLDGYAQNRLCPADGLRPQVSISTLCSTLPRRLQDKRLLLLEAVAVYGLRPVDAIAKESGIKLHTLLDLRGNIPTFVEVTEGAGSRRQYPRLSKPR